MTESRRPPQLKDPLLRKTERMLLDLARPLFVWRMAHGKLTGASDVNSLAERLKRVNALDDVVQVLAKHGFRQPRSTAGYRMGFTQRGSIRHVTEDDKFSLCGCSLRRLVTDLRTHEPVPYADHWAGGSVSTPDDICRKCRVIVERRG